MFFQITGIVSSVKKALLSVSSCLQDNQRSDANNFAASKPLVPTHRGTGPPALADSYPQRGHINGSHSLDYHSRGHSLIPVPENVAIGQRKFVEEEIVFRLLCSNDKVGSLIGKGGAIVRGLQNETGTSIKVQEAVPDSEERVVVISALEASTATFLFKCLFIRYATNSLFVKKDFLLTVICMVVWFPLQVYISLTLSLSFSQWHHFTSVKCQEKEQRIIYSCFHFNSVLNDCLEVPNSLYNFHLITFFHM